MFRGHPNFRGTGRPWRDWAIVDWGDEKEGGYGHLPCLIWCFVTLEGLDEKLDGDQGPKYGSINLQDDTYAVVEYGKWDVDKAEICMSDLFVPFHKVLGHKKRRFYLAPVDAIVAPMCVIPDIGCHGRRNKYFQVKPRSQWSEMFKGWLEDPSELDKRT